MAYRGIRDIEETGSYPVDDMAKPSETQVYPLATEEQNLYHLDVESRCSVDLEGAIRYGVVRWIGELEGLPRGQQVAGLEMDVAVPDHVLFDGYWNGAKIFSCIPESGTFIPLRFLERDCRLDDCSTLGGAAELQKEVEVPSREEEEANECLTCCSNPVDCALAPCMHKMVCSECAARLDKCPTCRTPLQGVISIVRR